MRALERLQATIQGDPTDRVPVSVWYHFGSEHLPPEDAAKLHLDFHAAYQWDFLKVNFDYRAMVGRWTWNEPHLDIQELLPERVWRVPYAKQQECLAAIDAATGQQVPLLATIYSPWFYLLRHVGRDQKGRLLKDRELTSQLVSSVTKATLAHVDFLKERGIWGIYFATLAANANTADAELALQEKHDRAILERAGGLTRVLHLHGDQANLSNVLDYPREVLHCENRNGFEVGLEALRANTTGAIMGGLAHWNLTQMSPARICEMVDSAIRAAGTTGFLLAPGCSVSPSIAHQTMLGIRDRVMMWAGCGGGS